MFFSKFFSKTPEQLVSKGDVNFKNANYFEARCNFIDAMGKLSDSEDSQSISSYIRDMITQCSNRLAELNINEAEAVFRSGNITKSIEYLHLAIEQADDVHIREKADSLIKSFKENMSSVPHNEKISAKHDCASCSSTGHQVPESSSFQPDNLTSHDQFNLLVHTLPGDLPERYLSLGEKFASAFLLAQSNNITEALNMFRELLAVGENDILLYETALIEFKLGRVDICESLLNKALSINPDNPMCNLSLTQLYIDTGRYSNAVTLLKSMMTREILHDQSLILLADVYVIQSDNKAAIELLSNALSNPSLKKPAAERLVAILNKEGRDEEAQYLYKTYLKGCC